jgi:protoporphyrinogen oxidase
MNSTAKQCDGLVILGGGLAGLAASIYTGAPIYEADADPGGVANTDRVDGYAFDRGIHILQTRNKVVLDLLAEAGVELQDYSRRAYIYSHGRYTPYPFQVNTAGLPLRLRARCLYGFLTRNQRAEPNNYREWIYRSVGRGFGDTFLIPYSEKFWTVDPALMTHEWTGNRIPQPTLRQVLRGAVWAKQTRIGTNVDFRYPTGEHGYGTIAAALVKKAGTIHLRRRAVHIDTNRREITFDDGSLVRFEKLISTIPLPELIAICPSAPQEVRAAAAKLWTNSIMVVNLGLEGDAISDRHWVHFPENRYAFFRISYPHTFSRGVVPPGRWSVSAEVAYSIHRPLDEAGIVERVIHDLRETKAIGARDRVVASSTYNIRYAYCVYDHFRAAALSTIKPWLATVGIVPSGRFGLWTYFWSDEAILSGKKAAENVSRQTDVVHAS